MDENVVFSLAISQQAYVSILKESRDAAVSEEAAVVSGNVMPSSFLCILAILTIQVKIRCNTGKFRWFCDVSYNTDAQTYD